jgi:putative flippase GtrA
MKFSKNFILFLIIGIITVGIDYQVYIFLYNNFFDNAISKCISFLTGTLFSFFANKNYNYKIKGNVYKYLFYFLLLYLVSMLLNVFINKNLLLIFSNYLFRIQISFLVATMISATINYLGMNLLFKKNK